jgi:hypothetical protein
MITVVTGPLRSTLMPPAVCAGADPPVASLLPAGADPPVA